MVGFEVVAVVLLSAVMFIASFAAGTVPLAMSLSQERMNLVSSLGIGLLVGTSLGVVLPEGIEMLYSSTESSSMNTRQDSLRKTASVSAKGSSHDEHSRHLAMALALITGYLIMHLLTYLPPLLLSKYDQSSIPMSSLPSTPRLERTSSNLSLDQPKGLSNTTIGLCIHALADGIALGSSAVSNNLALESIVFFAIMLHKALPSPCTH
jgi:solute carrier family 39 (zinc transporter), member 9